MSRAPKLRRRWTAASIVRFGACVASDGATLNGKVVAITDGDTLTAPIGERQIKVRLVEIDAPESSQAFGDRSKRSLADLCLDKPARLIDRGTDADGRMLARVECAGVDANEEQVRRGMAWVYDQYVTDRSLYIDQNLARSASRGLWSDPNPTRPWEWRHAADGRPPTSPSSPLVGDCKIKDNISSRGERIYHMPGQRYYDATQIDVAKGERWFCTQSDAVAAGWRRSRV